MDARTLEVQPAVRERSERRLEVRGAGAAVGLQQPVRQQPDSGHTEQWQAKVWL